MPVFAASINCIDGRVQEPVSQWIRENHGIEFVDVISEPGCDLALSEPSDAEDGMRAKVQISVSAHGTKLVFVSGHHECAANPVSREEHIAHVKKAVERVAAWNLPVRVIGLWVNDSWGVEQVT